MADKLHRVSSDTITITFDPQRCLHVAECVRGSMAVFDPRRRKWIDPEAGDADSIAGIVRRCPTGALHYIRLDGGPAEKPDAVNRLIPVRNGPLQVRGDIRIEREDGSEIRRDTRVALCRCGKTARAPLCDGSHTEEGFEDAGRLGECEAISERLPPGPLVIKVMFGGPLQVAGPVEIYGNDGRVVQASQVALCRCGASDRKPFCDGSHSKVRSRPTY